MLYYQKKLFFLLWFNLHKVFLLHPILLHREGMSLWKWLFYEFTQLTGKMFYFFLKPKKKQINQGLKTRTSEIQKEALQIKCWITPLRKENQALFSTDFKNKIKKCEHQKSKQKERKTNCKSEVIPIIRNCRKKISIPALHKSNITLCPVQQSSQRSPNKYQPYAYLSLKSVWFSHLPKYFTALVPL